jgi:hypothetical protein
MFAPESLRVGFVVDKVAQGQVFLLVLRFYPVSIIPPWLSIPVYNLGMNNKNTGGCSLETLFHSIIMSRSNN